MRVRGGKSLKEEEGRGCSEGEKASLKNDDRGGHVSFFLLLPSLLPKAGLMCACAHPRVGCWDFSILCQFTSFGKLCVVAEEGGESCLRASFPGIMQQVPTWQQSVAVC